MQPHRNPIRWAGTPVAGFAHKLYAAGRNPTIPAFTVTAAIDIYRLEYGEVGEGGSTKK